ncbi:MAG: holo-ACP synthase [Acidimicrobiales bacterium]
MLGIGVDAVEVDRFRRIVERRSRLLERVFTEGERAYADRGVNAAERYAARWAAKEAVLKALGAGLGRAPLRDIEVVKAASGAPALRLHGAAASLARERGVQSWLLSLTHTRRTAQAVVVALGEPAP